MIISLLTVLCLSAPAPQGPGVTFFDDTFAPGTWTSTHFVVGAGVTSATAAQTQQGNPPPAVRASHLFTGVSGLRLVYQKHLMDAAVYDPAVSGAIAQVHFAVDYYANVDHYLHVAVQQGSQYYVGAYYSGAVLTRPHRYWVPFGPSALTASDFAERLPDGTLDRGSHPDFTSAGAPVTFGLETSVSTGSGGPTVTLFVDIDNFLVSANGLPGLMNVRLGTPPNADVFRAVSGNGPVIGTTWNLAVDHQTFVPGATLDLVGLSVFTANVPTPFGTLLCNPMVVCVAGSAGQALSIPVPNSLGLVGQSCCLQAMSLDAVAGAVQLTNALDVTVGSF